MNRIESIEDQFVGSPTYNMQLLLTYLTSPEIIPEPNKYYVFVYKAKTPRIQYDAHPLILCTSVYSWGFAGDNVHIGKRQYSWSEVKSNVYELSEEEFQTLMDVPLAKYKTT